MLTSSLASTAVLAACSSTPNLNVPSENPVIEVNPAPTPLGSLKPARLVTGDTVSLVSPGFRINNTHKTRAHEAMGKLGLNYKIGDNAHNTYGYFAGTDEERAADINAAFSDDEVKAIIAYRGGWGSARILEFLDFEIIRDNPKIFIGMSDITALSLAINKFGGFITFNGPNGGATWNEFTTTNFTEILMEGKAQKMGWMPEPCGDNPIRTYVSGSATGELVGGTLTILLSLLGTPYFPDLNGKILFLEDTGEGVYRIDRMLTQLIMSGALSNIAGIVFGQLTNITERSGPSFSLDDILTHHLTRLGKPAIYGMKFGHVSEERTMPIGVKATLDARRKTLTLLEAAVT